ncbi:MAG: hypothetical protein Q8O32_00775 [bacterium]|nr:hypothetical protein [bacterium]
MAEIKKLLNTDKVFETTTSFGVNMFGKYLPNITFIIPKDFEENPLGYRKDSPVREMLADMNVAFNGDGSVLFGDFWVSQKGGACFRPKPIVQAQHVLVRINWGGAFRRSYGNFSGGMGEFYFRRAGSNGGGMGNDFFVFPVGFYNVIHDEEIDGEMMPPVEKSFVERANEVRSMFAVYDREQAEVKATQVRAKAQAEVASKAAKEVAFGARVETANITLVARGYKPVEQGEFYFLWNQTTWLYTEENVAILEMAVRYTKE